MLFCLLHVAGCLGQAKRIGFFNVCQHGQRAVSQIVVPAKFTVVTTNWHTIKIDSTFLKLRQKILFQDSKITTPAFDGDFHAQVMMYIAHQRSLVNLLPVVHCHAVLMMR